MCRTYVTEGVDDGLQVSDDARGVDDCCWESVQSRKHHADLSVGPELGGNILSPSNVY